VSLRTLHRAFAADGPSFAETLRRARAHEAARRLRETPWPVTDIGYAVGFGSVSRFVAIFTRVYGMSPAAYRAAVLVTRNESRDGIG